MLECLELTLLSRRASRAVESRRGSHVWQWAIHRPIQPTGRDTHGACTHMSKFRVARHSVGSAGVAQHCAVYRCRDRGAEVGVNVVSSVVCETVQR